jgi:hypothetical protein
MATRFLEIRNYVHCYKYEIMEVVMWNESAEAAAMQGVRKGNLQVEESGGGAGELGQRAFAFSIRFRSSSDAGTFSKML